MEPREPDIDQLVPRVERARPAYRIGRDNRSRVEGVRSTETIEPRSDFLDASVDQTDARNVPASSACRIARSFMLQGEKPTNRSQ
jgi:hypothetical protein